jgi:hypothetical protein
MEEMLGMDSTFLVRSYFNIFGGMSWFHIFWREAWFPASLKLFAAHHQKPAIRF